jgi:hypothetical protein
MVTLMPLETARRVDFEILRRHLSSEDILHAVFDREPITELRDQLHRATIGVVGGLSEEDFVSHEAKFEDSKKLKKLVILTDQIQQSVIMQILGVNDPEGFSVALKRKSVLKIDNRQARVVVIERVIRLMSQMYRDGNFLAGFALYSALMSASVGRFLIDQEKNQAEYAAALSEKAKLMLSESKEIAKQITNSGRLLPYYRERLKDSRLQYFIPLYMPLQSALVATEESLLLRKKEAYDKLSIEAQKHTLYGRPTLTSVMLEEEQERMQGKKKKLQALMREIEWKISKSSPKKKVIIQEAMFALKTEYEGIQQFERWADQRCRLIGYQALQSKINKLDSRILEVQQPDPEESGESLECIARFVDEKRALEDERDRRFQEGEPEVTEEAPKKRDNYFSIFFDSFRYLKKERAKYSGDIPAIGSGACRTSLQEKNKFDASCYDLSLHFQPRGENNRPRLKSLEKLTQIRNFMWKKIRKGWRKLKEVGNTLFSFERIISHPTDIDHFFKLRGNLTAVVLSCQDTRQQHYAVYREELRRVGDMRKAEKMFSWQVENAVKKSQANGFKVIDEVVAQLGKKVDKNKRTSGPVKNVVKEQLDEMRETFKERIESIQGRVSHGLINPVLALILKSNLKCPFTYFNALIFDELNYALRHNFDGKQIRRILRALPVQLTKTQLSDILASNRILYQEYKVEGVAKQERQQLEIMMNRNSKGSFDNPLMAWIVGRYAKTQTPALVYELNACVGLTDPAKLMEVFHSIHLFITKTEAEALALTNEKLISSVPIEEKETMICKEIAKLDGSARLCGQYMNENPVSFVSADKNASKIAAEVILHLASLGLVHSLGLLALKTATHILSGGSVVKKAQRREKKRKLFGPNSPTLFTSGISPIKECAARPQEYHASGRFAGGAGFSVTQ